MSDKRQFDLKGLTALAKAATAGLRTEDQLGHLRLTHFNDRAVLDIEDVVRASVGKASTPPPPPLPVLKELLRAAVQVEFTTIPLYLTALWSIIDQAHPVAKSIRAVAHEEMLHLALLCNLLSALGERPRLTGDVVPRFPGRFPGGVHPELELRLEGYSQQTLMTFMEIERPDTPIPIQGEPPEEFPPEDQTIGGFYAEVIELFRQLNPPLDLRRQIAGPFAWLVMSKPEHVEEALTLIQVQGEGARGVPYSRYAKYLSHYYRFKSLSMLTELVWDEKTKTLHKGDEIPAPSVFTLAPASTVGYGLAAPRELRKANERFETCYSTMLRLLEESWLEGGHKVFLKALEMMFELGSHAQAMMRIATPDGRGYCPSFRYCP